MRVMYIDGRELLFPNESILQFGASILFLPLLTSRMRLVSSKTAVRKEEKA